MTKNATYAILFLLIKSKLAVRPVFLHIYTRKRLAMNRQHISHRARLAYVIASILNIGHLTADVRGIKFAVSKLNNQSMDISVSLDDDIFQQLTGVAFIKSINPFFYKILYILLIR